MSKAHNKKIVSKRAAQAVNAPKEDPAKLQLPKQPQRPKGAKGHNSDGLGMLVIALVFGLMWVYVLFFENHP